MERKSIVKHDNESVSIEGDGKEYLQHYFEHQKGKGNEEEHCDMFGHDELHNIPHNESPINKYVETVFPGVGSAVKSAKHGPKSHGGGSIKGLHEKPDVM